MSPRPLIRLLVSALVVAAPVVVAQPGSVVVSAEGKIHADARAFPGGPTGEAPGLLLRRARAELTAEIDGWLRAVVEPDMGEGEIELKDGYVEADIAARLAIRVGQFKTPVGYESLRSSTDLRFAERAFPTALSPRRDLGAMLTWETARVEAQVSVFNGVADGGSADGGEGSETLDAAARVFGGPFTSRHARLGVGLAVVAGRARGADDLAEYETPGDREVFAYTDNVVPGGLRVRLAPQATFDVGRLHMLGEWTLARHHLDAPDGPVTVAHRAWQAAASVVIAGVPQGDDRPVPRRSVTEGGPGAVEVSARVHGLALDRHAGPLSTDGSARQATAVGLAVHWSPVAEARLGVTAERTVFNPFGVGGTPEPETFVVLRAQIDL